MTPQWVVIPPSGELVLVDGRPTRATIAARLHAANIAPIRLDDVEVRAWVDADGIDNARPRNPHGTLVAAAIGVAYGAGYPLVGPVAFTYHHPQAAFLPLSPRAVKLVQHMHKEVWSIIATGQRGCCGSDQWVEVVRHQMERLDQQYREYEMFYVNEGVRVRDEP